MNKILFCLSFLLLGSLNAFSQKNDTLDYVKHFGVVFPVQNKSSLPNTEFKKIIKGNNLALSSLRKARWIRAAEIATDIVAIVPLIVGINQENNTAFIVGAGAYGGIVAFSTIFYRPIYNKHIAEAIRLYNVGILTQTN